MTITAYNNDLEELRAWGRQQGLKGSRTMDPTSQRIMLDGFFHRFKLVPSASYLELKRDNQSGEEYWLFVGFVPWWTEPGYPVVPQSDLAVADTQRLRKIIKIVFKEAARLGELSRLTFLRGKDLDDVLWAVGV